MRHVGVPEDISATLLKEFGRARAGKAERKITNNSSQQETVNAKYIPVMAIVNGKSARVTLVPAGGGRFRRQINTALRKSAGVDAGDLVSVDLRLDTASRELPVPPDLRQGLKAFPKARKAFDAPTLGHLRHIIQYFDSAKSTEARPRRLERVIDALLERSLSVAVPPQSNYGTR